MKDLESNLKSALARVEPPEGFAERVIERAQRPKISWRLFGSQRPWLAAAALLVLLAGAETLHLHQQRQHAEEVRAQAQLMLALQITSHQLNTAFERISTDKENP